MHLLFGLIASTLLSRRADSRSGAGRVPTYWGALEVRHHLPGRIRFACRPLVGDDEASQRVDRELPRLPGVDRVTTDPRSGSIVVGYDPTRIDAQTVQAGILALVGLDHVRDAPQPAALSRMTGDALDALDLALIDVTRGAIDLDFAVPTALMAAATVMSLRKSVAVIPAVVTLTWWATAYMLGGRRRGATRGSA